MMPDIAKSSRLCALCEEPIKKGMKCLKMTVAGRNGWPVHINVHRYHIKPYDSSKCTYKMNCITEQHHWCRTPLCKFNRRFKKNEE